MIEGLAHLGADTWFSLGDRDFDAELAHLRHLGCDSLQHLGVDPVIEIAHQGLARQLQQYPSIQDPRFVAHEPIS